MKKAIFLGSLIISSASVASEAETSRLKSENNESTGYAITVSTLQSIAMSRLKTPPEPDSRLEHMVDQISTNLPSSSAGDSFDQARCVVQVAKQFDEIDTVETISTMLQNKFLGASGNTGAGVVIPIKKVTQERAVVGLGQIYNLSRAILEANGNQIIVPETSKARNRSWCSIL